MPNIDTLSIQFSAKGTTTAVKNIKEMGLAVRGLAVNLNAIDTNKVGALASSLSDLKKNAPTKAQSQRVSAFGDAVKSMASSFNSVNSTKINDFTSALTTMKKVAPTKQQAEKMGTFNGAISSLASTVNGVSGDKLTSLSSGMEAIKHAIPTKSQVERLVGFSDAVTGLSNAIGSANISEFAKDMGTLGDAVQTFKKSSVNSIANAATAMQKMKVEAESAATSISSATSKSGQPTKMGDNKGAIDSARTLVESLNKVEVKAAGVTGALQKIGAVKPTKGLKSLQEQAEKVGEKYEKLRSTLQKSLDDGSMNTKSEGYQKKMAELDALRNKYDELILKQKELAQEGGAFSFNPTVTKSLDAFKSGFSSVTGLIKNGVLAGLRAVNSHIKSFGDRVKQAGSALKNSITHGNSATNMAKKFANEVFRVSKMLKLMITRMALRKVIAEVGNGFKSLALHSQEFNNSMSSLINGSKKLGYSFAAMVSPLINALAPAITYVINLLTKLINVIQQVFASFTGATTWNKAKDFTDSWADSFEDANKSAKELKKTVLGFDELNQLSENKNSGSSGSGITDMFETMQVDSKWKEFADWLKDMWKLGDFTALGEKLGKGLRSLLESIPWDDIRQTSHKLGESLATLINGFVEVERLGYDIGYTIAQSVNTVFEFINGFVHKLHWDSIGKFIADTFNGFFENIDWALIKDTVVTGMAGLAESIQTFINEFHWDNISDFIINALDTIASGIKAFVEGIDWTDLGQKIGDQIAKVIRGTDWLEIGEAIGDIIQAGISWVSGLLDTLPSVEELVKAAGDVITGIFNKVDMYELGANLGKILTYIYNALTTFWDTYGDTIKTEVGKFFQGLWDNIDKTALAKTLAAILGAAALVGIASMAWTALKTYLAGKIQAAIISKTVTAAVADGVATAAGGSAATAAAATAGASLGTTLGAALIAAFVGQQVGTELGKVMFPDDAELYDQYTGISGFFKEIKDLAVGTADWVKMKWSGELDEGNFFTSLSSEEQKYYSSLKVHYGEEFPELMQKNIDTFGSYKDAWAHLREEGKGYYDETQAKLKQLSEGQATATKSYTENAAAIKGANQEVKDSLKGLDENSQLYKQLSEQMAATTTQAKGLVAEAGNVSTAYKGPTEAVSKYKKETEDSGNATRDWVEKHRQAQRDWDRLHESIGKATTSTNDNKKALENLSATTKNTTKDVQGLTDSISKEFNVADADFTKAVNDMQKELSTSFQGISDDSKKVTVDLPNDMQKAIDDIMKSETDLSTNTQTSITDIKKSVDDGTKVVTDSLDGIKKSMTKDQWTFNGVAEGLTLTFKKAREGIASEWNQIADKLNGDHDVGGSSMHINLPRFASGGFPEDGLFMANHSELVGRFDNGKTAVANNQQIIAGIERGVYSGVSAAMQRGNSSSQYISNEIIVDGEVLARSVTKAQDKQNRRFSPSMA